MIAYIEELVYNPQRGCDVPHRIPVDFDASKFLTKEQAAIGLYLALCKLAESMGYTAHDEVALWTPEENPFCPGQWGVCWESGPYQWAIGMSMQITGPWGFTEPYYGFDLHFTE